MGAHFPFISVLFNFFEMFFEMFLVGLHFFISKLFLKSISMDFIILVYCKGNAFLNFIFDCLLLTYS